MDEVDVRDEEEDDDVEEDDAEEENRSQDREGHVVRACAVEMHMDRSQEPFCVEIYRETWGTCHKSHFVWKCRRKMDGDTSGESVLGEPAQSKRTWTFHKSHFVLKFTGKMPDAPETTSIKHRA